VFDLYLLPFVRTTAAIPISMHTYLKNNPAKFHPGLIRNDGALGFFLKSVAPRRTTQYNTIHWKLI